MDLTYNHISTNISRHVEPQHILSISIFKKKKKKSFTLNTLRENLACFFSVRFFFLCQNGVRLLVLLGRASENPQSARELRHIWN